MLTRGCDIAVIGLGIMGSAALYSLITNGADALGFDGLDLGEARGSSHGSCRIFRRFNFESPAYTSLSDSAALAWKDLERATGVTVLKPCQVLEAGPPGSALIQASRMAAGLAGLSGASIKGADINAMLPAFRLPGDWDVALQDSGGILLPNVAIRLFRQESAGRVVLSAAQFEPRADGILVRSGHGETVLAQKIVIAAGPWITDLLPALARHIKVTRQAVAWFAPSRSAYVAYGEFPIFILDAPQGVVYGFPDFERRGVKAGSHNHGPTVDARHWGPPPSDEELHPVAVALKELVPGAFGPITEREVCLYTNTDEGDADGSGAEEFIIDRLPDDPRIIVASPCSGHGAKFASAIGRILARLAMDDNYLPDPAFRLSRFSSFAARS